MAAGRHGGYRDNEFRDRESNFEVPRRGLGTTTKQEFERNRNRNQDSETSRVQDLRGRGRFRQRDIKEREAVNGDTHTSSRSNSGNSSAGSDLGPRRIQFPVGTIDREPGELSSESGSDDATESNLQTKDREGMNVSENGRSPVVTNGRSPVVTKRKFSPIVWDIDDDARSNPSKRRINATTTVLPPPPPLPKVYRESPSVIPDGGVLISPVKELQSSFPDQSHELPELDEAFMSQSSVRLSTISSSEVFDSNIEAEHLEDEDYVPTRNISSSRWAAGNNSPVDEGELFEDDLMLRRQLKISHSESVDVRAHRKSLSPEDGEVKKQSSEANRVRSSDSDDLPHSARSTGRDDDPGNESGREDGMDVDEDDHKNLADASRSNTDSDYENDPRLTPERSVPQRNVNMLQGCRSVDEFERLNKIDEGTYGVVYRARDKKTGEIVALKKVKMEKEREGFPPTSLREINILLSFHHRSIVDVKEVVVGSSLDSIFMVMEYMEHDLKGLMESMKQPFSQSEVKCLMIQLLEGIKYLHDNWVLHRDLKTSNLLLNNRGELKICDFGLARQYGSPLKPYTHLVVTLWYRAPELLLGAKQYSTEIDMWSLGCIMAELLSKEPLFNGKTEVDQLDKIFRTLGTPNETIWPGFSQLPGVRVNFVKHQYNLLRKKFPATSFTGSPVLSDSGFDLLNRLLTYDPEKRITVGDALNHEWFHEVPLPKSKEFMPTFPAQHAQDRRMRRIMKSPDPLEEQRRKDLELKELGAAGLFG